MMHRSPRLGALAGLTLLVACAAPAPQATTTPAAAPPVAVEAPATSAVLQTDVLALPRPMTSFGAASRGGAIYAYGGYFGTPHAYAREGQIGDLLRVDPQARSVTSVWHGDGVQSAQLVDSERGLIRVGGMRAENGEGEPERLFSLRDVGRFDESTRSWQALPELPEARSSHAAVVHRGRLYVLGGWTLAGNKGDARFAESTLVLDLESGKWSAIAQPFRVRAAGAGVLGDKIVLVGGIDAGGTPLASVHVLDTNTQTWTKGKDYPDNAFGIAVVGNGRALYASARDGLVRELEQPDGDFRVVAALAFPRFFHQLVMVDEQRVAALGGITGMDREGRIAHVEVVDLASTAPRVLSWTLENPSPAKNRQGVGLLGSSLLTFGGNRSLAQHDFAPDDFRSDAHALNLANMHYEKLPDFPKARQTVQTVTLEGALLALGGFGHDGEKARAHAEAYRFDAEQGKWLDDATVLPSPRTQFGLVSQGDELWVFGGLDYDPSREEAKRFFHPTSVLKAKQGQAFAEAQVTLPHPRRAFGGALLDGRYVLVGGMADGFTPVESCDVFDFKAQSWSSIACPAPRISPQLVALDGKLYLAGGSTPSASDLTPNPRLEVYDPRSGAWSTLLEQIPLEPRHLTVLAYRHALLFYSAHQEDGSVRLAMVVPPVRDPG